MSEALDRISPLFMGADRIAVTLDESTNPPLAERPITVNFDYSAAGTVGVVLPLILELQPAFGVGDGYVRRVFRRAVPPSYTFKVYNAGLWLLVIREARHNRWQGRLVIDVGGEKFSQIHARG